MSNEDRSSGIAVPGVSRRAVLATGAATLVAGCQSDGFGSDARQTTVDIDCEASDGWRQYQTDAANSGTRTQRTPPFDAELTSVGSVSEFSGGVVVDDARRAFFGDQQAVRAIDVREGDERWRREFNSLVSATPVLACNAVVVQTSVRTYALDRSDGTTLWEASPGNQFAEPLSDGRHVFVASSVPTALDLRDGSTRWSHDLTDVTPWGCCLGDGCLVVTGLTDRGGVAVGLDAASGDRRWRTDLPNPVKASPTYRDGTAYVPDEGTHLVALSIETGDVEWRTRPYDSLPGGRWAATPTVAGDTVVVPSGNGGTTAAVDRASGETVWEVETGPTLAPPVATGSGVVVGTMNEGLFLVDADGTVVDRRTDTRAGSQMALTDAGLFYKTAGMDVEFVHLGE